MVKSDPSENSHCTQKNGSMTLPLIHMISLQRVGYIYENINDLRRHAGLQWREIFMQSH